MSTTTAPDLAHRVSDHMTTMYPTTITEGGWTVARDTRDGTAVVVWQPGDEPVQPQVRGMLLYRWLCSLRDAGFTGEARLDMAVFGRPEETSRDRIARWLHVTGWSEPAAATVVPLPPLPPKVPHRDVALPPALAREFRCPLSGIVPGEVHVRYLADGSVDMTLVYESGDQHWGNAVPRPPAWLLELVEQHRPVGGERS